MDDYIKLNIKNIEKLLIHNKMLIKEFQNNGISGLGKYKLLSIGDEILINNNIIFENLEQLKGNLIALNKNK